MIRWRPTTFGIAFQCPIAGTQQGTPAHPAAGLYDEQEQLIEKLLAAIHDLPARRRRDFRAGAAQYDWRGTAPRYDEAFEGMRR
jgi:hypothetical protein